MRREGHEEAKLHWEMGVNAIPSSARAAQNRKHSKGASNGLRRMRLCLEISRTVVRLGLKRLFRLVPVDPQFLAAELIDPEV